MFMGAAIHSVICQSKTVPRCLSSCCQSAQTELLSCSRGCNLTAEEVAI